jgi:hypothetical protein
VGKNAGWPIAWLPNKETNDETEDHCRAGALACSAGAVALAQNSNQGVSKTEITIGSIQDLSGPIAGFGKQVRLGMMLRVDEINEQGGINGRKLKLWWKIPPTTPRRPCWPPRSWSTRTRSSP